jgi:hypothetical protein
LRAALEVFRASPVEAFMRDQPKALKDIIVDLRSLIQKLQSAAGRTPSESLADSIIRKSTVVVIDLENSDPLESALVLTLQAHQFAAASMLWAKVITDCIWYAKNRQTLIASNIAERYEKYRVLNGVTPAEAEEEFINVEFGKFEVSVGKEVLLCNVTEKAKPFPPGFAIFESYRFVEECKERIGISESEAILSNGVRLDLLRRASTFDGIERAIEQNPSIVDGAKLTIYPMNIDENLEDGVVLRPIECY